MKKLISAATSLCMAASMVGAVVPATVGAVDATKGFSIKTYDINNPSVNSGKSEITLDLGKDFKDGKAVIPCALYYSESKNNSTGSLQVCLTTDSKDISFAVYDPTKAYTSSKENYTLGGVSFSTNCYLSFAGYCKSARAGYKAAGKYILACEPSQSAANTDNYFIGCSWMNNGSDYSWAGETSDAYPFYVFDTIVPDTIKPGIYKVTYCDYNTDQTGVNDNPSPMVESDGERYTKKGGNLKLNELTVKVTNGDEPVETTPTTTSTTTTSKTTTSSKTTTTTSKTTTSTTTTKPIVNGDVNFAFVDENGNDSIEVDGKKGAKISLDVNIDAGNNDISSLDVQFKKSKGFKITDILESANAFDGVTVSSNLDEYRASYVTLDGDKPMKANNGESAFMLDIEVPAGTPAGTYYVDFDNQCKVFKDNTSFNYKTSSKPYKIVVTGEGTVTPDPEGDVSFEFVDENGNDSIEVDNKKGAKISLDVNINAGNNDISSLDVQFQKSKGFKITDILESANAFDGVTVSSNLDEYRASYVTLDGDKPMKANNGESAFMLDIEVPAGTPAGTYYVDFADQCKVFKDNTSFNYKTSSKPYKIVVKGDGTVTPDPEGDVSFEFVDENGNNSIEVDNKKGAKISLDVNINAGNNDISSLDVQFQKSKGFKITDILESANAFDGVTVSSNLDEYRASYVTLDGDKPMKANNGESAFMLDIEVPAGTPAGTYYVDFADQCKVFKDNTSFNYKTASKPYKIVVTGEGDPIVDPEGDVSFEFVDENGNNSIEVDSKKGAKISLDVNINAGNNDISSLDVQFQKSKGFKITDILESANAFDGVTVSSNLDEYRASYVTLDGDKPMKANNGESAFMLDIEVPAGTPAGTYYVDFADQCKVFKDNTSFNYKTSSKPYKIVVKGDGTVTPDPEGDVTFKFVDENGNSTVKLQKGTAKTISVDVLIEAGNNDISSLDVQFKTSDKKVKISNILESANAFEGVTVSSNLDEYRASYVTLDGDKPMKAVNGESAFMLDVDIPADLPAGEYTVGFGDQCKVFKDNTSFNYKTDFAPLTIIVEEGTTTTETTTETTTSTTSTSTTSKTTTSTTSKTTTSTSKTTTSTTSTSTSTTTTTPPVSGKLNVTVWGDTNCDGVVNVADVVVLNRLLNDPSYVVKNPTTKADVTAQGKVNADVVDPQNKDGKNIDPKTVKLTGADSEAIAMFILEKGNIPQ